MCVFRPGTTWSARPGVPARRGGALPGRGDGARSVPLYGPPGSAALVTGPGAVESVRSLVSEGPELREDTPARSALQLLTYHPGRDTVRVSCPILFCVSENDEVIPPGPALRYIQSAERGEVRTYPEGHFGLYRGEGFEAAVTDQITFLKQHV